MSSRKTRLLPRPCFRPGFSAERWRWAAVSSGLSLPDAGRAAATFGGGEIKDQRRPLARALVLGTAGVVALYLGVNVACLHALGPGGLAAIDTPASEVMRRALGPAGATAIAAAIAISTFGFLAQGMLACPRVYYAMAQDGLFFKAVGRRHPRTQVPHVAIVL